MFYHRMWSAYQSNWSTLKSIKEDWSLQLERKRPKIISTRHCLSSVLERMTSLSIILLCQSDEKPTPSQVTSNSSCKQPHNSFRFGSIHSSTYCYFWYFSLFTCSLIIIINALLAHWQSYPVHDIDVQI